MRDFFDKYFHVIFWPIVIFLLTWASWYIVTGRETFTHPVPTNGNGPIGEIPPAVVDQPILEEVSADGSVRWTLYLDRIIREEGSVMELARPRALYRFESGEVLEVTGDRGTYNEDAHVLILSGNVHGNARNAMFEFSVDNMTWDSTAALLSASGGVEINRGGIQFTGEELHLNLAEEFAHVQVTGGESGVTITSTEAELENITSLE